MVEFTAEEFRQAMDNKTNIRNISVVGHLNHGKTTITNFLVEAAGTMRPEDVEEGALTNVVDPNISARSTVCSLLYEMSGDSLEAYKGERSGNQFLVHLIDSPGHVDFCAEATAALTISDGALLVVDCFEGVCVQTETVLRQAMTERVRPILCLSMMDKLFSGLQVGGVKVEFTGEQVYRMLFNVVENSNGIMKASHSRVSVSPAEGTVAFSSGLHGWAFTLTALARKYTSKFGLDESEVANRLWGDNFFDSSLQKWSKKHNGSRRCTRGFVKFCYEPIEKIFKACMEEDKGGLWGLCRKLGVSLNDDEKQLLGDDLFKCVMQSWLAASTSLFEMMIVHIPSPSQAQKYRVKNLYESPLDNYADAIRNCDRKGPLMVYISKMIPTSDASRFFAFGRVFSGQIATGMTVRIMGSSYVPGKQKDAYTENVLRTVVWMGKNQHEIHGVPSGNIVGLIGFHECITKSATLTGGMEVQAWPIRAMKLSQPHILSVEVKCRLPLNAQRLCDGLKRLTQCDLAVLCSSGKSGSFTVAVVGEFHLEVCLEDLKRMLNGVEYTVSSPIVSHRETVLDKSGSLVETISQNKFNAISIGARPLPDELVKAIDNGLLSPYTGLEKRSSILLKHGLDELKIWCFGPEDVGPNMVVDRCETECPDFVKESIVAGFELASKEGALANENLRGICFEVHSVNVDAKDGSRERSLQIDKMVARAFLDSQLAATPRILEPVYTVVIQCPDSAQPAINGILNQRGGYQYEHFVREETKMFNLRFYLSVYDSFGLARAIKVATCGQVTPHLIFDHWDDMSCSPTQAGLPAATRVLKIRERKNMGKPSFHK